MNETIETNKTIYLVGMVYFYFSRNYAASAYNIILLVILSVRYLHVFTRFKHITVLFLKHNHCNSPCF